MNSMHAVVGKRLLISVFLMTMCSCTREDAAVTAPNVKATNADTPDQLILNGLDGKKLTLGYLGDLATLDVEGEAGFGITLEDRFNYSTVGISGQGDIVLTNNQSDAEVRYYGGSSTDMTMFTVGSRTKGFFLETAITKDDIVWTLVDKGKKFRLRWNQGHLVLESGPAGDKLKKLWSHDLK